MSSEISASFVVFDKNVFPVESGRSGASAPCQSWFISVSATGIRADMSQRREREPIYRDAEPSSPFALGEGGVWFMFVVGSEGPLD